jgi:lipoprotein-anchoring transpeptidase ErfK/SrfK
MRILNVAAFVALGLMAGSVATTANAVPRTYYDTETHTFKTYDPDEMKRDAYGGEPPETNTNIAPALDRNRKPDPKFDRQEVDYDTTEEPGTIVIDTKEKFLFYVLDGSRAIRMGVGVGREGFGWAGTVHVGSLQENPKWFPPDDMVKRQPELEKYQAEGMPGGDPGNPLGVRAIYLHDEKGKDTLYRIHGTIEPWSIGLNVSSGCIRMLNENVTELYDLVKVGTKVIVI